MRLPAILAVVLALVPVACNTDDGSQPVGTPGGTLLVTPDAVVGKVTVANSETTLIITVAPDNGWDLQYIRLALGTELGHIPQTRQGAPIPGRFPLRKGPNGGSEITWRLPLKVEPGTVLYFAVQAEAKKKATEVKASDPGHTGDDETCTVEYAWGAGNLFPGQNEAMYFTYTIQKNQPPGLSGQYRTETQEDWGGDPQVDPAAMYLAINFDRAFPLGVTIGTTSGFSARFTSAEAVAAFIPQRGPAGSLGRNWVDPAVLDNSLAGNTLALAINIGFDVYFADFSPGPVLLQDMMIAEPSSPFFGLMVGEVLALANQALAGQDDPRFTPDQIDGCVARINMNFRHGLIDLGFVGLP
jgi:hypothetical protein